jgi:hypothetical protein
MMSPLHNQIPTFDAQRRNNKRWKAVHVCKHLEWVTKPTWQKKKRTSVTTLCNFIDSLIFVWRKLPFHDTIIGK